MTYISGKYAQSDPSYPPLPQGWMRVYGPSSLAYWPTISGIDPGEMVDSTAGSAAELLARRSVEQLRTIFDGSLASATSQAETLGDGTPVEVVTVTLKASALPASVYGVSPDDPVANAIYKAATGTPVQHRFILDASGHLRGWEQTIALDAQGLDVAGVAGFPAGTRLDISAVQSVAFYVSVPDRPGTIAAPAAEAMTRLPGRAHSAGHPAPAWASLDEFDAALNTAMSGGSIDSFWQQVAASGPMPLLFGNYGVFLYRGPGKSVAWSGDWPSGIPSQRLGDTDMWMVVVQFVEDVRAEYQIEVDGKAMLDPLNPAVETGGLGSKSVLTMPGYAFPTFTLPREGIAEGKLTDNMTVTSKALGYAVNFRVYTPAGYDKLKSLPTLYVTDGQDYLQFGKMVTVLDNLIADGKVQPLIAVFIDPRDTVSGRNLREEQFLNNPQYGQFIVEELVPAVDAAYRTNRSAEARALLGASYGG
ncbi:MAG: esterase family protein, partial [Chloroflexi bacterium]|nr:esterase family protein [Chloroflexota bacterium]